MNKNNKRTDLAKGTPTDQYHPLPRPDLSDSEWVSGEPAPRAEPEKTSDSMIEDIYLESSLGELE